MEVAGRWRREWAGAAEYGKVARDGVVVRTARALEVLQASRPGARVRVTRSAFHAQGPLSTTFMLHSSTRTVLSSGVDVLLSPSLVSKPLEISSTPLDAASDSSREGEAEPGYRVTEPDDTDISEPSKWRSGAAGRCAPSDASSSADTASIADAALAGTDTSSGSHHKPANAPLMKISEHAECLSSFPESHVGTVQDEWHDRRNSYGFEDTAPNDLKSLSEDDKIAMESSTDSGICKSTEIVNIPVDKYLPHEINANELRAASEDRQETFQDWLAKNRSLATAKTDYSFTRKGTQDSNLSSSGINLKSYGKISIALPTSSDRDSDDNRDYRKSTTSKEVHDKSFKKVGFSKTEFHFTAESGKVKIIETDEKPPPTADFRKRRTAFEPMRKLAEKPITLFGGENRRKELSTIHQLNNGENREIVDQVNIDQDTDAAVKSILKNRIPKPRPYLLGEDIGFGARRNSNGESWSKHLQTSDYFPNDAMKSYNIAVLNESLNDDDVLINKPPLEHHIHIIKETQTDGLENRDNSCHRERNSSPVDYVNISEVPTEIKPHKTVASTQTTHDYILDLVDEIQKRTVKDTAKLYEKNENLANDLNFTSSVQEKLKLLQLSPIMQSRIKTRNLTKNELSYFGVTTGSSDNTTESKNSLKVTTRATGDRSAKPPSRKSKGSIRSSKEAPLYQNLPLRMTPVPVPAPRNSARPLEPPRHTRRAGHLTGSQKHSNDESNCYHSDDDVKGGSVSLRDSAQVLETINELKAASVQKHATKNRTFKVSGLHNDSSPNTTRVDAHTRKSKNLTKSSSRESVERGRERPREGSQERAEAGRADTTRRRRSRTSEQRAGDTAGATTSPEPEPASHSTRHHKNTQPVISDNAKYVVLQPKVDKTTDSIPKKLDRGASERVKDRSLQRKPSVELRSSSRSEKENRGRSRSKEISSKRHGKSIVDDGHIKDKKSHNKPEQTTKSKYRNKEYVLNYDEKNGTLSSISREPSKHSSTRRQELLSGEAAEKIKERSRDKLKTSGVTTMEMKNPMIPPPDARRRTKSADPRSSRRKPREVD